MTNSSPGVIASEFSDSPNDDRAVKTEVSQQ